jgi:hypothetical protein
VSESVGSGEASTPTIIFRIAVLLRTMSAPEDISVFLDGQKTRGEARFRTFQTDFESSDAKDMSSTGSTNLREGGRFESIRSRRRLAVQGTSPSLMNEDEMREKLQALLQFEPSTLLPIVTSLCEYTATKGIPELLTSLTIPFCQGIDL